MPCVGDGDLQKLIEHVRQHQVLYDIGQWAQGLYKRVIEKQYAEQHC